MWIFQGQTLPPPSDSVWRPSWPLSCKPEGKKTGRKQFSSLDHHHLLGQEAKTNWRGLGKVHQLVWGRFISYFFRAAGLPNAYIWTCWSLNVFFTCNPHLLILSLGSHSLQMLQGFHTLSLPHQLSWLKRCLQIKGGGYATSEKAFVLQFLSLQSSTFTFKLLILHLGSPGRCLAWRWRCSRVPFLVNFPGWGALAFKYRGGCTAREKMEQKRRFLCPSQIFTFTSIVLLVLHLCSPRKCPAWSVPIYKDRGGLYNQGSKKLMSPNSLLLPPRPWSSFRAVLVLGSVLHGIIGHVVIDLF